MVLEYDRKVRWPKEIPVSVCTLGITGEQSRAHCAAALMYAMRMTVLKMGMVRGEHCYILPGGRRVWDDHVYNGFRRFEIARIEQVALQLNKDHQDAIFAQADEFCKLNSNSVKSENEESGQT